MKGKPIPLDYATPPQPRTLRISWKQIKSLLVALVVLAMAIYAVLVLIYLI